MNTDFNFNFSFEEKPHETHCANCGSFLDQETAIFYINGNGFCNKLCEQSFSAREQYSREIGLALDKWIKPLYADTDMKRLKDGKSESLKLKIDKILNWNPSSKGMIIHGDTGVGKTRILTLLLKRLIETNLYGVEKSMNVFYSGELEFSILTSFKKIDEYEKLIRKLSTCKLLVIDDFGKEKFSERYEISIFNIIENRAANMLPTIITTNFAGNTLKARFSDMETYEPFIRRLREFHDIIGLYEHKQ